MTFGNDSAIANVVAKVGRSDYPARRTIFLEGFGECARIGAVLLFVRNLIITIGNTMGINVGGPGLRVECALYWVPFAGMFETEVGIHE